MKKRNFVFVSILFLVLSIPFIVNISQQRQEYREHAAGTSSYPANIEYNNAGYGVYSQSALTNPNINGIDVTMDWYKVEPTQGVFNWTPLDNELQAWGTIGKKLVIIIRYVSETSATRNNGTGCPNTGLLPAWEAARIPTFCDSDKELTIPDYFDATFQSDLKAYVQAISDHIAASQYKNNIVFVRVGLGLGGEAFPLAGCLNPCNQTDYQADIQQLQAWGWTPQTWEAWQESMLSFEKSAFPFTTVVYGATTAFTPESNPLNMNPVTGKFTDFDVAIYAAANGIGVGQQGMVGMYKNGSPFQQIISYINLHYPNTFIQFAAWGLMSKTPPCVTNPTTTCEVNIIQNDIQALEQYNAKTMDWWYDDDVNPAFQSYFAQWQQYVDSSNGGAGTPSPTQPILTPSLTPILPSATPTIPPGHTSFAITLCPHGLGNCGDNVNAVGGNANPIHKIRTITVAVFDTSNNPVGQVIHSTLSYSATTQNFQGVIDMGILDSGRYFVKIKMDGFLAKQVSGVVSVVTGQQVALPQMTLTTGDINNDNQIDISDYNIIVSCYGQKLYTSSCPSQYQPSSTSPGADIVDDDRQVDGGDYNEFIRELSVQVGQ